MAMLAFRAVSARRLVGQVAALFGVALTLAAAIRWGPPGWEGPWPLSGGLATVVTDAQSGAAPAAVAFLTIQAVPSTDGTDVVLYRDGWRVGTLAGGSTRVAVHAGDVLALQLRVPVRVSVGARGAVASPEGWWALSPATPARRLPLVVLRQGMGGMV